MSDAPYTGEGEFSDAQRRLLLSLLGGTFPPGSEAVALQLRTASLADRTPTGEWRLTPERHAIALRLSQGHGEI